MENYIDSLIEKAFSDGYEFAQKEFAWKHIEESFNAAKPKGIGEKFKNFLNGRGSTRQCLENLNAQALNTRQIDRINQTMHDAVEKVVKNPNVNPLKQTVEEMNPHLGHRANQLKKAYENRKNRMKMMYQKNTSTEAMEAREPLRLIPANEHKSSIIYDIIHDYH